MSRFELSRCVHGHNPEALESKPPGRAFPGASPTRRHTPCTALVCGVGDVSASVGPVHSPSMPPRTLCGTKVTPRGHG